MAVLVYDADMGLGEVDPELWERDLAEVEWSLVSEALQRRTSLEHHHFPADFCGKNKSVALSCYESISR